MEELEAIMEACEKGQADLQELRAKCADHPEIQELLNRFACMQKLAETMTE